jgi:hypothetical protein
MDRDPMAFRPRLSLAAPGLRCPEHRERDRPIFLCHLRQHAQPPLPVTQWFDEMPIRESVCTI